MKPKTTGGKHEQKNVLALRRNNQRDHFRADHLRVCVRAVILLWTVCGGCVENPSLDTPEQQAAPADYHDTLTPFSKRIECWIPWGENRWLVYTKDSLYEKRIEHGGDTSIYASLRYTRLHEDPIIVNIRDRLIWLETELPAVMYAVTGGKDE